MRFTRRREPWARAWIGLIAASTAGPATSRPGALRGGAGRLRRVVATVGVALVFAALTMAVTFPLSVGLHDHVPNLGDPLHVAWILSWDVHALTTAPARLFDANTIYPLETTLALSEHMLGVVPLFAVPYLVTGNEIFALNVVILLSFVLSGLAVFALVRAWTGSAWAGLVAGVVFAFAPIRTGHLDHAQLMQFYWTPFALFCLERYLARRRTRDLVGFAVCWTMQGLSSVYLTYLSVFAVVVYAVVRLAADRGTWERDVLIRVGAAFGAVAAVVALVHLPYVDVQHRWRAAWGEEWIVRFSASPLDYVGGRLMDALVGRVGSGVFAWEKVVWLGTAVPLLIIAAVALRRTRRGPWDAALWAVLVVGFVLSLGPVLVLADLPTGLPLPHRWLSSAIPGFGAMRVPARFGLVVALAGAGLAGLGAYRLSAWLSARALLPSMLAGPAVAIVFAGAFLVETWRPPMSVAQVERRERAVDAWLAADPNGGAIAEVPRGQFEEYGYTYYSRRHWRKLLNGVSSFMPGVWFRLAEYVDRLPAPGASKALAALGVRQVVVHTGALKGEARVRWEPHRAAAAGLVEVARFGADVVYSLPDPPSRPGRLGLDVKVIDSTPRRITLGLTLEGLGPEAWIHPRPFGRTPVVGRWSCDGKEIGGEQVIDHVIVPFVVEQSQTETFAVRARRPKHDGECVVTAGLPALGVSAEPLAVRPHVPSRAVQR